MGKREDLDELTRRFVSKDVTAELKAGANKVVMGEGNPDANVVLIGEAPGAKEDLEGRPFIGAAGKFLDQMLESIGYTRDDVFITSIVKYRPPKNRDPKPAEIAESESWLKEQLAIIQPKLIVFLGRFSMNVFFPELKISEVHGQVFKKDGQAYMALYHPAAALYNGSMRQTLLDDFSKIPAAVNAPAKITK